MSLTLCRKHMVVNQLKVHPLSKFWFQICQPAPLQRGGEGRRVCYYGVLDAAEVGGRRRCKIDPGLKAPPRFQTLIVKKDTQRFQLEPTWLESELAEATTPRWAQM